MVSIQGLPSRDSRRMGEKMETQRHRLSRAPSVVVRKGFTEEVIQA